MADRSETFDGGFVADPAEIAGAIARISTEDAVSLPLLDARVRRRLLGAAARLPYRLAKPLIGEGEKKVRQDFVLCMPLPPRSLFHVFAAAFERLIAAALARLDPAPLPAPPCFNDLIVQRYEPGSRGITPHLDHIRYEGLVALLPLSGAARFFICDDRAGRGAREIPAPSGNLMLLRAPGFGGTRQRPFHFLRDVTRRRTSLGLRHDARAA
jgi:hypothetical protein